MVTTTKSAIHYTLVSECSNSEEYFEILNVSTGTYTAELDFNFSAKKGNVFKIYYKKGEEDTLVYNLADWNNVTTRIKFNLGLKLDGGILYINSNVKFVLEINCMLLQNTVLA